MTYRGCDLVLTDIAWYVEGVCGVGGDLIRGVTWS